MAHEAEEEEKGLGDQNGNNQSGPFSPVKLIGSTITEGIGEINKQISEIKDELQNEVGLIGTVPEQAQPHNSYNMMIAGGSTPVSQVQSADLIFVTGMSAFVIFVAIASLAYYYYS
jgi:hypothetical protein